MAVHPLSGVTDPSAIVDVLVGERAPRQLPAGEVVIAEVSEETTELLRESAAGLKERRRDVHPCLVGIPGNMEAATDVAESFEKTLLVDESKRDVVQELLPFLPSLFHKSVVDTSGVGSARLFTVDIRDCPPDSGALVSDLQARKGQPLHDLAGQPEVFSFAASPAYHDAVHRALSAIAPVAGQQKVPGNQVTVIGFNFEDPAQLTVDSTDDAPSREPTLPRPPRSTTDDTPVPEDRPNSVTVSHSLLDEIAAHAVATPETEIYGTIYADEQGRVRHYHPIESEEHVLRSQSAVRFQSAFYDHVRTLAQLYDDIDCRLCGEAHSHPSGSVQQSQADKEFSQKFWRTERNTCFIVGVKEDIGPARWEVIEDVARKQLGSCLVRIKAYSGAGGTKTIRLAGESSPPAASSTAPLASNDVIGQSTGTPSGSGRAVDNIRAKENDHER
jgi:proteasome lid subunit RPN8/RPN11